MKIRTIALGLSILLSGSAALLQADDTHMTTSAPPSTQPTSSVPPVLRFTMKSLAGKDVDLAQYQGKVILFVNTASKCGNTPQYAPLEALHEKYGPQGLAVLGFPCNDFGHQEPGTAEDITTFCTQNYGVKFDMFAKIDVKGPTAAPLYQLLTTTVPVQKTSAPQTGDISWNFEKFLVARDGTIVARFTPKTQPNSPEVIKAIEAELAKTPTSNS